MEHIDIDYYGNESGCNIYNNDYLAKKSKEEKLFYYYELQNMISDDFKRLEYILESYSDSEDKKDLLNHINYVLQSIKKNRFDRDPEMFLTVVINDSFLTFSYYDIDENGKMMFDTPSVVILSRNIDRICFITEIYSIFTEQNEDEDYNKGYDEIRYFTLKDKKVYEYKTNKEEYTTDLFSEALHNPRAYLDYVKSLKPNMNKE